MSLREEVTTGRVPPPATFDGASEDVDQQHRAKLRELEKRINKGEHDSIRARWESGVYLLNLRRGKKQLPAGLRGDLEKELKVSAAELTARMKFASKYSTDELVADVISKYRTWFGITQEALTDKPRTNKAEQSQNTEPTTTDASAEPDAETDHQTYYKRLSKHFDDLSEELDPVRLTPDEQSSLAVKAKRLFDSLKAAQPNTANRKVKPVN